MENANNNISSTRDIATTEDLLLLTVVERFTQIFIPSAHLDEYLNVRGENEEQLSNYVNRELEVHSGSRTGRFLHDPDSNIIGDIIQEARRED